MLISAWIAPPHAYQPQSKNFNTLEQYRLVSEVGLNCIYGLYENAQSHLDEVLKAIDYATQYNISYIVRDERLKSLKNTTELKEWTDGYIKAGAKGVLVVDEPGAQDFTSLAEGYKVFQQSYPNHLFYTNLMPMHANTSQLTYGAWEFSKEVEKDITPLMYYNAYAEITKLPFISFDIYPFEYEYPMIRPDYFTQMQMIYEVSKSQGLIPICFIQTCSFNSHVRVPKPHEILWNVNTSIAYGMKGIQYFTYFIPANNAHEQFKGALVDEKGEPTNQYYAVKEINQWLVKISPFIMNGQIKAIKHLDEHLLCTTFELNDHSFKMYVNISLTNEVKVETPKNELIITMYKQETQHFNVLKPGEAIIVYKEGL